MFYYSKFGGFIYFIEFVSIHFDFMQNESIKMAKKCVWNWKEICFIKFDLCCFTVSVTLDSNAIATAFGMVLVYN